MPRPRICRRIGFNKKFFSFVPRGIKNFEESVLSLDEFEAIRLVDMEGFEQAKAAKKMGISQPTLSRILKIARRRISRAIINGHSIKIKGGNFEMVQQRGMGMGRMSGAGGRGRMGGVGAGPGGVCKCPKCGYEEPQIRGVPCMNKKCPKCGANMIRG